MGQKFRNCKYSKFSSDLNYIEENVMDTGEGKFEFAQTEDQAHRLQLKYPNHGGWFHVGEEVVVKGSRFRVKSVKPNELRLKLLKRVET